MLILNRRKYEAITIGDDIEIIILENARGVIKVGINAPKSLQINRADYDVLTNKVIKKIFEKSKSIFQSWTTR